MQIPLQNNSPIELLAPCGSKESFRAAIQAGCDSIYFGVEQLNMRTRSSNNFTIEDLSDIATTATKEGIKAYITLNTILYDHDMPLMRRIVNAAADSGIHGIIASDHAAMKYAKSKGVPVHISTQANVTNIETIDFYSDYADVMVLSRELTLDQVKQIVKEIKRRDIRGPGGNLVKVEVFAHGALCMAVSGKCYLSLHSNFSSANRGACVQNCRRSYIVKDKEEEIEFEIDNEYIMSAKDLCTIDFLDKVIDSGISVLKIEGRGRSEEYVFTVTKCYKEAIDAIASGTYTQEKIAKWKTQLATVFNRGFWDGYYLGREIGEWNNQSGSRSTKKKIFIGKGIKYYENVGVAEFKIESQTLRTGDEILVSGPTTGVIMENVQELRVNGINCMEVKKGETITMPLSSKIRPSDKLYKFMNVE